MTRHDMSREMMLDISRPLLEHPAFEPIYSSLVVHVEEQDRCPVEAFDCGIDNAIRWRRHIRSQYDLETKSWRSVAPYIAQEDICLLFFSAAELAEHIQANDIPQILAGARSSLNLSPTGQVILLVAGFEAYYRQTKVAEDRVHRAAVTGSARPLERSLVALTHLDKQVVEKAITRLALVDKCQVIQVEKSEEIVRWLVALTAEIGLRRTKSVSLERSVPNAHSRYRIDHLTFCPDQTAKSGSDLRDTYVKMLTCVPRVTQSAAEGIVDSYPTIRKLYEAWDVCPTVSAKEGMLSTCQVRNPPFLDELH